MRQAAGDWPEFAEVMRYMQPPPGGQRLLFYSAGTDGENAGYGGRYPEYLA